MNNEELEKRLQHTIEEAVNEMYLNTEAPDFFAQVYIDIIDGIVDVEVDNAQVRE